MNYFRIQKTFLFVYLLGSTLPFAHPRPSVTLNRLDSIIKHNPSALTVRAERSWLELSNGHAGPSVLEDVVWLSRYPEWVPTADRLHAHYLFLQGKFDSARIMLYTNIESPLKNSPDQFQLLAKLELSMLDTNAALAIWKRAWNARHEEGDLMEFINLHRAHKSTSLELLRDGFHRHPKSPGVCKVIFEAAMSNGTEEGLEIGLIVSSHALDTWPKSSDWRLRNAQALFRKEKYFEVEAVLLDGLKILDESSRFNGENSFATDIRKDMLELLVTNNLQTNKQKSKQ